MVPEILEGSLQLAGVTLRHLGLPGDEVRELIEGYRRADYAKLSLTTDRE